MVPASLDTSGRGDACCIYTCKQTQQLLIHRMITIQQRKFAVTNWRDWSDDSWAAYFKLARSEEIQVSFPTRCMMMKAWLEIRNRECCQWECAKICRGWSGSLGETSTRFGVWLDFLYSASGIMGDRMQREWFCTAEYTSEALYNSHDKSTHLILCDSKESHGTCWYLGIRISNSMYCTEFLRKRYIYISPGNGDKR